MALTIDPTINSLAAGVASATGEDKSVVLAHWQAEQGVNSVDNWYNFNPAGIRPGNPDADRLAIGVKKGFNVYPNAVAGAQAYTAMISGDRNYAAVRDAIQTGDVKAELDALINSPWDSGHYTDKTKGDKLYNAYAQVTGATIGTTTSGVMPQPGTPQEDNITQYRNTKLKEFLGIPAGVGGKEIIIVTVGCILIILFIYRLAIK